MNIRLTLFLLLLADFGGFVSGQSIQSVAAPASATALSHRHHNPDYAVITTAPPGPTPPEAVGRSSVLWPVSKPSGRRAGGRKRSEQDDVYVRWAEVTEPDEPIPPLMDGNQWWVFSGGQWLIMHPAPGPPSSAGPFVPPVPKRIISIRP